MAPFDFFDDRRLTGVLLILAFILFAIGGTLPVVGKKGNMRIWTLPVQEHLQAVANNANIWRWANTLMGAAAVALLAGMSALSTLLEGVGERVFSPMGLVGIVVVVAFWLIFSAFRAAVTITAAQELTTTGAIPAYFEPLARWSHAIFVVYAVVGFLALSVYAVSILRVGLLPGWAGWATLVFSIAMLIQFFAARDTLPAFHYLPPLVIGVLLLLGG